MRTVCFLISVVATLLAAGLVAGSEEPLTLHRHPVTGNLRFVEIKKSTNELGERVKRTTVQDAVQLDVDVTRFSKLLKLFGIENPSEELEWQKTVLDPQVEGAYIILYRQRFHNIPVTNTHIVVRIDSDGQPSLINGNFESSLNVSVVPKIDATVALKAAKIYELNAGKFLSEDQFIAATNGQLNIYCKCSETSRLEYLAYEVEILQTISNHSFLTELVYVDASSGLVVDWVPKRHYAINRQINLKDATTSFWVEGDAFPTVNDPVNAVIVNSKIIYDSMITIGNWPSWDGKDSPLASIVDIPQNTPLGVSKGCPTNAVYSNGITYFCETQSQVDVIYHEWQHGYNEGTANLVYVGESGAMDEAYADIVGESLELLQHGSEPEYALRPTTDDCASIPSLPTSSPPVTQKKRWVFGQTDPLDSLKGGTRDLWNPNCRNQPRSAFDSTKICALTAADSDHGGVHTNSGIINQLFSLLVDGGSVPPSTNTVTGIGVVKALNIFLRVLFTMKIRNTPTFLDLSTALKTSCSELVGAAIKDPISGQVSAAVTSADCDQLNAAIAVIGIDQPFCSTGSPSKAAPTAQIDTINPTVFPLPAANTLSVFYPLVIAEASGDWPSQPTCNFFLQGSAQSVGQTVGEGSPTDSGGSMLYCPLPTTITTPGVYTVSITDSTGTPRQAPAPITIYATPVVTALSQTQSGPEDGVVLTVTGSNFQKFTGCNNEQLTDVYDVLYDCLTCYFGTFDDESPVNAVFINSNTIQCRVPKKSLLNQPTDSLPFSVALNGADFHPTSFTFQFVNPTSSSVAASTVAPTSAPTSRSVPSIFQAATAPGTTITVSNGNTVTVTRQTLATRPPTSSTTTTSGAPTVGGIRPVFQKQITIPRVFRRVRRH